MRAGRSPGRLDSARFTRRALVALTGLAAVAVVAAALFAARGRWSPRAAPSPGAPVPRAEDGSLRDAVRAWLGAAMRASPAAASDPATDVQAGGPGTATTLAAELRRSVCACTTRSCIDDANRRYVRGIGAIAGRPGAEATAEMRAATRCIQDFVQEEEGAEP
jgi:hypothetical protein